MSDAPPDNSAEAEAGAIDAAAATRRPGFVPRGAEAYFDRRIWLVLALSFSSGLPAALIGTTLTVRMREAGIDLTTIGLFALTGLPFSIKFLFAPFIDRLPLPGLTRLLGQRRGWAIATQICLGAAILGLGMADPAGALSTVVIAAVTVALCSACQDIVIDAYRIEILEPKLQGAGVAAAVNGWRLGFLMSGAGALALAEFTDWTTTYFVMASLVMIGMTAIALGPEPPADARAAAADAGGRFALVAADLVIAPFRRFATDHPWWPLLLVVIVSFKFGDVLLGTMAPALYRDLGFTKGEIAAIAQGFGLAATITGSVVGGFLVARFGLATTLVVGGVSQLASNLAYIALAATGRDTLLLAGVIAVENFTSGIGTAAFVGFISSLCAQGYAGTQYALLTSFTGLGRDLFGAVSGRLADVLGWQVFFLATIVAGLPALAVIAFLIRVKAIREVGRA